MRQEERAAMEAVSRVPATWRAHPTPGFVSLVAGPCPYYDPATGCTVYAVRPFNCRRFACLRGAQEGSAFDAVWMRAMTRDERRQLTVIQRHASRWARTHGWTTLEGA